ncbi:TolB family protein [Acanthopleuribacter pedis]|uniref:PD40 domain-containing protein n=1 Tax=Acanthopleuribacter pedis TaxID=442870 RepID=A0A8J7Q914_9BACT|nr:PD40 domain-containing protein [Acanthopleuribacter pedis]MBO1319159.1 PD40 domain-containing protein [Acanthopleuribacter pedis]
MIVNSFTALLVWGCHLTAWTPPPTPTLWMPGTISRGFNEREPSFSPDGRELMFWLLLGNHTVILTSKREGQGWREPETAPFSGRHADFEPVFSPDGSSVYFVSNRPRADKANPNDANIWRVAREGAGWGEPSLLPERINGPGIEFFPSSCHNHVLYFCRVRPDFSASDIYRVDLNGNADPKPLPEVINDGALGAKIFFWSIPVSASSSSPKPARRHPAKCNCLSAGARPTAPGLNRFRCCPPTFC